MTKLGDAFLSLSMWLWLTYAVGPWEVGVLLLLCAIVLNVVDEKFS